MDEFNLWQHHFDSLNHVQDSLMLEAKQILARIDTLEAARINHMQQARGSAYRQQTDMINPGLLIPLSFGIPLAVIAIIVFIGIIKRII